MKITKILVIVSAIIFLISCSKDTENVNDGNYKKLDIAQNSTIVCFGNSLTQGWGARGGFYPVDTSKAYPHYLAQKVNIPVINLGISGETSQDALSRVDEVLSYNPAIIFIEFGANDLFEQMEKVTSGGNINLSFVEDDVEKNFEEMLERLVNDNRQIYLVKFYNREIAQELLKGEIEVWGEIYKYDYMFIYSDYENMFARLKTKYRATLISNIWDGIWGKDHLMYDGDNIMIHPNADGYRIMADNYFKTVKGFLEFNDLLL
ncbi:MAG: GDSL-type esterase/lipase family protein [Chitinispirillales bacterium]|jgi:lysophospholipase L1-like esterase|nr:GDSL-type esterase/lipase family protein [Chitinispirillales bacterium]